MSKLKSTLPNMILSLGAITVLSGFLLGMMYSVTKGPIEESAREQQTAAIAAVLPHYDNDPEADMRSVEVGGKEFEVYPAMSGGHLAGAAVKGYSMDGFAGEIVVMCGFDAEGNIIDYRVLRQAETPGLGEKMEAWFRDPSAARSVIGRSPATCSFTPSKDGGDIDGITAATISSRAFLSILREAYDAYRDYASSIGDTALRKADGASGASSRTHDDNNYKPEEKQKS